MQPKDWLACFPWDFWHFACGSLGRHWIGNSAIRQPAALSLMWPGSRSVLSSRAYRLRSSTCSCKIHNNYRTYIFIYVYYIHAVILIGWWFLHFNPRDTVLIDSAFFWHFNGTHTASLDVPDTWHDCGVSYPRLNSSFHWSMVIQQRLTWMLLYSTFHQVVQTHTLDFLRL